MARESYLTAIGTSVPQYKISQSEAPAWLQKYLDLSDVQARAVRALYKATGIEHRYSVIPDFTSEDQSTWKLYGDNGNYTFPGVGKRMEVYAQHALPLAKQACMEALRLAPHVALSQITHIVVTSCTGMYAPGLDIELLMELGLSTQVERTSIGFMGCYAAFNALKVASAAVEANPNAKVLVVCVELCTLHLGKGTDRDSLTSQALFGDGAAAVIVESTKHPTAPSAQLLDWHSALIPSAKQEMAWKVTDDAFAMTLSSYVPSIIGADIQGVVQTLLNKAMIDQESIHYWGVHPGGRKILEEVTNALKLEVGMLDCSYEVLSKYGNMSSATVLFVWKEILEASPQAGSMGLSMAFGPGLTVESGLWQIVE